MRTRNLVAELIASRPDDWLDFLRTEYKIHAVEADGLVSLMYNLIESPLKVPVVQQCRGMVVDLETREVVAWPYDKFWSLGEALAAEIDWATAEVQEKLDGSLMILYWHPRTSRWRVASSGHPTAGGPFGTDRSRTFADAFWATWEAQGCKLPVTGVAEGVTFMLELCAPETRIVVKHAATRVVLHGARSTRKGNEAPNLSALAEYLNCPLVKSFPLDSAGACALAAAALNPVEAEGFVVVDAQHRRVKVKSPRYVALHHMKGEFSRRRAIQLWQAGETSELAVHFPELREEIDEISGKLNAAAMRACSDYLYTRAATGPDRKAFALRVKDLPWASVCFKLFSLPPGMIGFQDARAALRAQSTASLERLIEVLP